MPLPILVDMPEKIGELDPDGKEWDKALKQGFAAATKLWKEKFLPEHFKPEAKGKYHHQPRDSAYLIRKIKLAAIGKVLEGGLVEQRERDLPPNGSMWA